MIQEARSVYLLGTAHHAGDVYRLLNPKTSRVIHSRDVKWIRKTWAELYKIKMIDRASRYLYPDEDFQLEEEEDQDIGEEESNPGEDNSDAIQVNHKWKNQQRPQLECQMMSQWLQEQEAKLQQMNQLWQEQDKHLGQALK